MKKIIRLTESDLTRIVKRVINENLDNDRQFLDYVTQVLSVIKKIGSLDLPGWEKYDRAHDAIEEILADAEGALGDMYDHQALQLMSYSLINKFN